ncbi:EEV maturation protein [Fowlpox virus]|nr:EEV maturation protein [Fowlpox virus]UHJ15195.1 EEV maturation protein [Fowlpox virus]
MALIEQLQSSEQSILSPFRYYGFKDFHNVIFTTIDDETLIVITVNNVPLVTRLITFEKITFFRSFNSTCIITSNNNSDIDTDTYFIPNSLSLLDILKKRAYDVELRDLSFAIMSEMNNDELRNSDIVSLNKWLHKHNLLDYKLVLISDIDRRYKLYNKKNTIIDVISVNGRNYNIWVKDVIEYYSPEYLRWSIDIKRATESNNWLPYSQSINPLNENIYAFEFIATLERSNEHLNIGAIFLYPDIIITGRNNEDIIEKFLDQLEEVIYKKNSDSIVLTGYHLTFLENTILERYISKYKDWIFTCNRLVHCKTGTEVFLFDAAIFFPSSNKKGYVKHWTGKKLNFKNFFQKDSQLEKYINNNSVAERIYYLQSSLHKHISCLIEIFELNGFDFNFSGLLDILIFSIRVKNNNGNYYYPKHSSAVNLMLSSIYTDYYAIDDIDKDSKKLVFNSIFPLIMEGYYPEGKPYYTKTPKEGYLSICLCDVEISNDIKNPILYCKENKSARKFTGVFTSVDIDTAVKLRGYKIKILECIEWPNKIKLFDNICYLNKLFIEHQDYTHDEKSLQGYLFSYLLKGNVTEDVLAMKSCRNNLSIISFIISYCRNYTYKLLECPVYESSNIVKCKYNQVIYK